MHHSSCSPRKCAVGTGAHSLMHGMARALPISPWHRDATPPSVPPGVSWACNGEDYATDTPARRGGQTRLQKQTVLVSDDDGSRVETWLSLLDGSCGQSRLPDLKTQTIQRLVSVLRILSLSFGSTDVTLCCSLSQSSASFSSVNLITSLFEILLLFHSLLRGYERH